MMEALEAMRSEDLDAMPLVLLVSRAPRARFKAIESVKALANPGGGAARRAERLRRWAGDLGELSFQESFLHLQYKAIIRIYSI